MSKPQKLKPQSMLEQFALIREAWKARRKTVTLVVETRDGLQSVNFKIRKKVNNVTFTRGETTITRDEVWLVVRSSQSGIFTVFNIAPTPDSNLRSIARPKS